MSKVKVTRSIILDLIDETHDEITVSLPPAQDPRWVTEYFERIPEQTSGAEPCPQS